MAQVVFNGNLDPTSPNLSVRFTDATSFFIEAPLLNAELEIDVFLQIYVPGIVGETARNIPLGKIEDTAIRLNVTDTETATSIPIEYQNTGLEMALLFLASSTTYLYASVIKPDCNLVTICATLDQINERLTANDTRQQILETLLNLVLSSLGVPGASVIAGSLAASIQQQFFYLQ